VDENGALAAKYGYELFEKTTSSGASSTNPFQFTGREQGPTGLAYMSARYYNPALSRFISSDPIGFAGGTPNTCSYAFNSRNRVAVLGYDGER
jgi:RHS repeat-associated protein